MLIMWLKLNMLFKIFAIFMKSVKGDIISIYLKSNAFMTTYLFDRGPLTKRHKMVTVAVYFTNLL